MFDARSLLEALVRGAAPPQQQVPSQGGGGLGDLLAPAGPQPASSRSGARVPRHRRRHGQPRGSAAQYRRRRAEPRRQPRQPATRHRRRARPISWASCSSRWARRAALVAAASWISWDRCSGRRRPASRKARNALDQATGASDRTRDAIGQATGKSPEDLLNQLKDLDRQQPDSGRRCRWRSRRHRARHAGGPGARRQRAEARRIGHDRRPRLQGRAELPAGQAAARAGPADGPHRGAARLRLRGRRRDAGRSAALHSRA